MLEPGLFDAVYRRLRERIAAKDLSAETLRQAALDALDQAHQQLIDTDQVSRELDRLKQGEDRE
jgi:hypothetical protein